MARRYLAPRRSMRLPGRVLSEQYCSLSYGRYSCRRAFVLSGSATLSVSGDSRGHTVIMQPSIN